MLALAGLFALGVLSAVVRGIAGTDASAKLRPSVTAVADPSVAAAPTIGATSATIEPAQPEATTTAPQNPTQTPISGTDPTTGPTAATAVLATLPVLGEHAGGYQRTLFAHWVRQADGCTTRAEVLIRDSRTPVGRHSVCTVDSGEWLSPYDGALWSLPGKVQIDHMVPLKEAWDSGAWAWSAEQRRAFANDLSDPHHLQAVTGSVNQSKSDRDPAEWLPPLAEDLCAYIGDWIVIKARWHLSVDPVEHSRLTSILNGECAGLDLRNSALLVPPPIAVPPAVASGGDANSQAPVTTTSPPPGSASAGVPVGGGGDVYYANCSAVRAAGAAPLLVGEPGYRRGLDRDGDGVACE